MELPDDLKNLYRHWKEHTPESIHQGQLTDVINDKQLAENLTSFIDERMNIWIKKYSGRPAPYTHDPILRQFRFCNILRELDRQTIEYHTLLLPLRDNFPLWLLNMFYARMVARPDTVRDVGLLSFDSGENERVLRNLRQHAKPVYGTPYVFPVSTIMRSATPTREEFLTRHLPAVIEEVAQEISSWKQESVLTGVEKILPIFGFNHTFLWTEVLIDVAYQYPETIDLFAPFPIGPGAAPTLKRISETDDPTDVVYRLGQLQTSSGLFYDGAPIVLSAENWEGIGCEFRKYTNLSLGKGRRRIYRGK